MALSSTKAEYIAATLTTKEGLWLKSIIDELAILKISEFKLWCDNQSCIKITKDPKITEQNKHIRARHHFISELLEEYNLSIRHTSTQEMSADFLTKPVPNAKHWSCCHHIGLSIHPNRWVGGVTVKEVLRLPAYTTNDKTLFMKIKTK